jgi:hypothetical protein
MTSSNRRTFLKVLGGGAAAAAMTAPLFRALADPPSAGDGEFFVFIHAAGGWDVTLWSDPRNERRGLVEPASTDNTDTTALRLWTNRALDADTSTFELIHPTGSNITFGPGAGGLTEIFDRITIINGIAMNTVSHPDGTFFSSTGRHLAGGRPVASSLDTIVANEFGTTQLFPLVSVNFPSTILGAGFDQRATPLRVSSVGTVAKSLTRTTAYDTSADRDEVTALLSAEATELAQRAYRPEVLQGMALQYDSLRRMLAGQLQDVFSTTALQTAHPEFDYRGRFDGPSAVNLAFAVEAIKRNVVRCVSFALGSFDTHNTNYRFQAQTQQETFDLITALVRTLDATPHPTLAGARLSEHTHILVISDFCRTPQINLSGGRDHYPNNSSLIISPKFRSNFVFSSSDPDQVLPNDAGMFADGTRPIAPPDVMATFVSAFGIDPRRYLRDGDVVQALLAT